MEVIDSLEDEITDKDEAPVTVSDVSLSKTSADHKEEVKISSTEIKYEETNVKAPASCDYASGRPSVAYIHATATFESSPFTTLDKEEINSILRCFAQKDHLRKNIADVKFSSSISRPGAGNLFKHVVGIMILVKMDTLWESPRSYIWRHLGQDGWKRSNGTTIELTKIHQK